jgi:hypothetical protein
MQRNVNAMLNACRCLKVGFTPICCLILYNICFPNPDSFHVLIQMIRLMVSDIMCVEHDKGRIERKYRMPSPVSMLLNGRPMDSPIHEKGKSIANAQTIISSRMLPVFCM